MNVLSPAEMTKVLAARQEACAVGEPIRYKLPEKADWEMSTAQIDEGLVKAADARALAFVLAEQAEQVLRQYCVLAVDTGAKKSYVAAIAGTTRPTLDKWVESE